MNIQSRRDIVYLALAGFFVTNAIRRIHRRKIIYFRTVHPEHRRHSLAGGIYRHGFDQRVFRPDGVERLDVHDDRSNRLCVLRIPRDSGSLGVVFAGDDAQFQAVFGQSLWIIVGSVIAFALSQMIDVFIFWVVRHKTGGRYLWMRATGSTVVSQLIDSIVIIGIAFWLPGKVKTAEFFIVAGTNYSYKMMIAVAVTPLLYLGHSIIDRYLGIEESHRLIERSAQASGELAIAEPS